MGIIRPILNPSSEEADAIRDAFDAKRVSEPVLVEQRKNLSAHAPSWVNRIDEDSDLRQAMLAQLNAELTARISVLEGYPSGPQRDSALDKQRAALDIVAGLLAQLEQHQIGGSDDDVHDLATARSA